MRQPTRSVSFAEFWGRRWNTALHALFARFAFRPLTRKGNQWYFGLKAHIGADRDSKLVHTARLLASLEIPELTKAKLRAEHATLDPFVLKKNIETKLEKFFTLCSNLNREATMP